MTDPEIDHLRANRDLAVIAAWVTTVASAVFLVLWLTCGRCG